MSPMEENQTVKGNPKVSVIMPIYNGAAFLEMAVAGVLSQTHPDWELLMVDDGSTDGSYQLADQLQRRDPRIRLFSHPQQRNRGVSASRNLAIREASGEFLATLDCDDEWLPDKLTRQLEVTVAHPETVLVYSLAETIDAAGKVVRPPAGSGIPGGPYDLFEPMVTGKIWIPCPTALARTETVKECNGFDETLDYQIEDHLLFTRLAETGPVFFVYDILARYRIHPTAWTATLNQRRRSRAYMQFCDRLIRAVPTYRRGLVSREYVDKWKKLTAQGGLRYLFFNLPGILAGLGQIICHPRVRMKDRLRGLVMPLSWPLGKLAQPIKTFLFNPILSGLIARRTDARMNRVNPVLEPDRVFPGVGEYLEAMAMTNEPVGSYRFSNSSESPLLYASVYALLTRHLLGDLTDADPKQLREWALYLLSYQCRDGLFRDPAVVTADAELEDDWGWRHLSAHVVTALTALGVRSRYPFVCVQFLYGKGLVSRWLESLNWTDRAAQTSNKVMNHGVLLQYNRDFWGHPEAGDCLSEMYLFFEKIQDSETGLWGGPFPGSKNGLSMMQQTAYHLWILYAFDGRPIPRIEKAVDSCLALQNHWGGFGPGTRVPYQPNPLTSACEDIDCIDPLCRFYFETDHRREEVAAALSRSITWVLHNRNPDGGFVFRRGEKLTYGHPRMSSDKDESNLFAAWFRTLSLAYISRVLPEETLFKSTSFQFIRCPGYQFWHPGGTGP